jgi:lysophospholipid acyltransferase (LPLAT)-like uncharacterized protein
MITLQFTVSELKTLDRALMQMPYGEVALLVESIKQQLQQQNNKEDGNVSIAP